MSKNIIGFVLIDAPHSALNNAGSDVGARAENTVVVKTIKKGKDVYPYVSSQAWRYWWRETLANKFNWEMSPITREKKIAFTSANPFQYPDDDIFGYMRAVKGNGGTLTRVSILKNSPLVSVCPAQPINDFGVMARHEGDPVPYEHQFYSCILKGIFSLNTDEAGKFFTANKSGFQNLTEDYVNMDVIKDSIEQLGAVNNAQQKYWELPKEIKKQRITDTIKALPFLSGGAKLGLHLTDVTPKFIILALIEGGNQPFMNITSENNVKILNIAALKEVIRDYKESFISDIYIGKSEGFLPDLTEELIFSEEEKIKVSAPMQAVNNFISYLNNSL
jgi:CRISPR-associated protein Cst2